MQILFQKAYYQISKKMNIYMSPKGSKLQIERYKGKHMYRFMVLWKMTCGKLF